MVLDINDFQFPGDDDIPMGEGFPIHRVAIDQSPEAGARIFDKMTTFPWLEPEMHGREPEVGCHLDLIGRVRSNPDAPPGQQQGMSLGGSELGHDSGTNYRVKQIRQLAKAARPSRNGSAKKGPFSTGEKRP